MFLVSLDRIRPNPWQTRQEPNPEHIRELAADIAQRLGAHPDTSGLLQVPLARIVDAAGDHVTTWTSLRLGEIPLNARVLDQIGDVTAALESHDLFVQLAFGHNRAAAFRLLANGTVADPAWLISIGLSLDDRDRFALFPVEYAALTDEQMASAAWSENAKRQDLSAVEQALAIQRALETFGWSHKEAGERWGLSPSAISNKLRLLRLPKEVQGHIRAGEISERQAMAVAPIFELPEPLLERAATSWTKPENIIKSALGGESSEQLRDGVDRLVMNNSRELDDACFPLDEMISDGSLTCDECPLVITHKRKRRCPDYDCWDAKKAAWSRRRLEGASQATGIAAVDARDVEYNEFESFYGDSEIPRQILAERDQVSCGNLRLMYAGEKWQSGGLHLDEEGFPDVRVICLHGKESHCECLRTRKAALTRERNANDPEIQARKQRERQVTALVTPADQALATALQQDHAGAWLWLLRNMNASYSGRGEGWPFDKVIAKVADTLLRDAYRWDSDQPERVRAAITKRFEQAGLALPWPEASPLARIEDKLERVAGWIRDLATIQMPAQAALIGNVDNLGKLQEELATLEESDKRQDLEARITRYLEVLENLESIAERWDFGDDGGEWILHGSSLVNTPASDINFKTSLEQVGRPNVIEYAAALLAMQGHAKTNSAALARRLRALESESEERQRNN